MTQAIDNVGKSRELYIIMCMDPKHLQHVEINEKLFFFFKWHTDVKIEQVVLRISILIWEMNQSDWEKL
jgi:hypothetical protein